jgi:hypothetical protein
MIFSCTKKGNEFVGEWISVKDSTHTLSIAKNGDNFLFTDPSENGSEPATLSNGIMKLPTKLGYEDVAFIDEKTGYLHRKCGEDEKIFYRKGGRNSRAGGGGKGVVGKSGAPGA